MSKVVCCLVLSQATIGSSAAAEPWIELKATGARITVVTDAGEKIGRKVTFQITQFDRSLQKRFTWIKSPDTAPLTVFASAEENTVRSMAPDANDGEKDNAFSSYMVTSVQHVGALRTDALEPTDKDRSPYRAFYRGRAAHLVERSLGKTVPSWLSRGLATFLADTVVKDKEVVVGRAGATDGGGAPLSAPSAAELFREGGPADRKYDSQAGLFVQYLWVGEGGKNAPAFDTALQKLAAKEPAASVQAVLAKVISLYAGFPKYLASKKVAPLRLPIDPSITLAGFLVRPVPLGEALMLRAEILFELNRPVDTRGLLRLAEAADPTLARPLEIEAILFEREQRSAESKRAIELAIQLGSKNGSLYYRLAQLQWSRTMAKPLLQTVQKLLETAHELSPEDPAVLSYLAEIQSDLGLTQPALDHAQAGASAASFDVYAQMALARAQWNMAQTEAAQATAQKALALAKLSSQKQRIQEFQAFASKNKRVQVKGAKPYPTQFGPPPAGAFGATRSGDSAGAGRVNLGQARTDSADASAITDCFAHRNDAACARAVPALEAACAERQTTSCVSLGSLYDGGFGVARDRKRAAAQYKIACDLADKAGCARLAVLEAQGLGVPMNAARATKILESLCGGAVTEACVGLAQILQKTGFAVDRDRARSLLKAACDGGSAEACGLMTSR